MPSYLPSHSSGGRRDYRRDATGVYYPKDESTAMTSSQPFYRRSYFGPALVGAFFALAAFILLLCVCVSVPVSRAIYFLSVSVPEGNLRFGNWGACLILPNSTSQCTNTTLGYHLGQIVTQFGGTGPLNNNPLPYVATVTQLETLTAEVTTTSGGLVIVSPTQTVVAALATQTITPNNVANKIQNSVDDGLTYSLVLHPIACAFAFLALCFALCGHLISHLLGSFIAFFAFLLTLVAFGLDLGLFIDAKNRFENNNIYASLGNANWLVLAAMISLLLATFTICCTGHRRENVYGGGAIQNTIIAPRSTVVNEYEKPYGGGNRWSRYRNSRNYNAEPPVTAPERIEGLSEDGYIDHHHTTSPSTAGWNENGRNYNAY